jgi:hypothetical protein
VQSSRIAPTAELPLRPSPKGWAAVPIMPDPDVKPAKGSCTHKRGNGPSKPTESTILLVQLQGFRGTHCPDMAVDLLKDGVVD